MVNFSLQCRPFVSFDDQDAHIFDKEYLQTAAHTTSLLTVQCACSSPKLMEFYVMDRPN